jgi:hypothetical protein
MLEVLFGDNALTKILDFFLDNTPRLPRDLSSKYQIGLITFQGMNVTRRIINMMDEYGFEKNALCKEPSCSAGLMPTLISAASSRSLFFYSL